MRRLITLFVLLFVITKAPCQTEKKYWMLGGNGSYAVQNENSPAGTVKGTSITVLPDVGYFFMNRTAAGIKGGLQYSKSRSQPFGLVDNTLSYNVGPFLRYYFLNDQNRWNLLAEASYQYYYYKANGIYGHSDGYTLSGGPVFFFNTAVGLEILANYKTYNTSKTNRIAEKIFLLSVGFQIHLHNSND
jgi:hypothetical protein